MRLKVSQITQTEKHDDNNNRERGIRGLRPLDSLFIFKKKNTEAETASEVAPVYTHSCGKRLKIVCEVAQPICLVLDFIFRFFFISGQRGIEKQIKKQHFAIDILERYG